MVLIGDGHGERLVSSTDDQALIPLHHPQWQDRSAGGRYPPECAIAWENDGYSLFHRKRAQGAADFQATEECAHSFPVFLVSQRRLRAFEHFFCRLKEGEKDPGYPRFKGNNRFDAVEFPS